MDSSGIGKKLPASPKPMSCSWRKRAAAASLSKILSSNSDGKIIALAPASSSSRTLSKSPVSGDEEGTSGLFSFKPKYSVDKSIITGLLFFFICSTGQVGQRLIMGKTRNHIILRLFLIFLGCFWVSAVEHTKTRLCGTEFSVVNGRRRRI